MDKEIKINGKEYILKESIQYNIKPKSRKGLEFCIVRTYSAGVFAGWFDVKTKGKDGIIFDSRRLWFWKGAASLSQLAIDGVSNPNDCKFPCIVPKTILKEIIEIIPCTKKAMDIILEVPIWKK